MHPDCVFCKIVGGSLPAHKVYEDADTVAFLDIAPIVKGHTLVIPKAHHDPLMQTPPEVLQQLIVVVQRVAQGLVDGLGAQGVNVVQTNGACAGQVVPHIHFHVIPRYDTDGHHWNWRTRTYDSAGERQALADRLRAALG